MTNDSNFILILTALMMREAKVKYDLGFVNKSDLRYNGRLVGMIPRPVKYVQDNSNRDINYSLGAKPKQGGFRR